MECKKYVSMLENLSKEKIQKSFKTVFSQLQKDTTNYKWKKKLPFISLFLFI